MTYSLYLLPLVGAAIGWLTNYIAVKMLFHPRQPIRLLFFSIQGVFPRRQQDLAKKLGQIVSEELFSVKEVSERLAEMSESDEVVKLVQERIEQVLVVKLPQAFPMAAMFLSGDTVKQLSGLFAADIRAGIRSVTTHLAEGMERELDVHRVVEEKVAAFSSDTLEHLLLAIMRRELRFVEFVGAVLGFLIGLVQIGILRSERWWSSGLLDLLAEIGIN